MGRKAFVNDLRDAALPGRFAEVSAVSGGDDDGTIKFMFQSSAFFMEEIEVDAMVSGTSSSHNHWKADGCLPSPGTYVVGFTLC